MTISSFILLNANIIFQTFSQHSYYFLPSKTERAATLRRRFSECLQRQDERRLDSLLFFADFR